MGRDKARLRVGRRTMLGLVRKTAGSTEFPVRVVRQDCVPRCGPIGGIYTGLKGTRAEVVLFLACDMPFVSVDLIQLLVHRAQRSKNALFVRSEGGVGFPLVMRATHLEVVTGQIEKGELALHDLAKRIRARIVVPPRGWRAQLRNINTPADWEEARRVWRHR